MLHLSYIFYRSLHVWVFGTQQTNTIVHSATLFHQKIIVPISSSYVLRANFICALFTFPSTFSCTLSLHLLQGSSPLIFELNFWLFVPVQPLPVQWPTTGATAGPLPASQPGAPAIGSLELIHPAEPCKAPFVPSSRLDQTGDRHFSLDWLSVSQPVAINIQAQTRAWPNHH